MQLSAIPYPAPVYAPPVVAAPVVADTQDGLWMSFGPLVVVFLTGWIKTTRLWPQGETRWPMFARRLIPIAIATIWSGAYSAFAVYQSGGGIKQSLSVLAASLGGMLLYELKAAAMTPTVKQIESNARTEAIINEIEKKP